MYRRVPYLAVRAQAPRVALSDRNMNVGNTTRFPALYVPWQWCDGTQRHVVIVKGTFDISAEGDSILSDEQLPVYSADVFAENDERTNLLYKNDVVPYKPYVDVAIAGHAYAQAGEFATATTCELNFHTIKKTLLVKGDQVWAKKFFFLGKSNVLPFRKIPLSYTRAFGGKDTSNNALCFDNPVGTGFRAKKSKMKFAGQALPNFYYPGKELTKPGKSIPVAGFGFLGDDVSERVRFLGTYDRAWEEKYRPGFPPDFSYRYYNSAPTDQQLEHSCYAGKRVSLRNLSPRTDLAFKLTSSEPIAQASSGTDVCAISLLMDTVCFIPDEMKYYVVWRGNVVADSEQALDAIEIRQN